MINVLIRIGMALMGLVLLIEVTVPPLSEASKVDRHEQLTRHDASPTAGNRTDTVYRLHFFGSRIASCDVGATAYDATTDGDQVVVRYSRVFKNCTAINRAGLNVYDNRGWRWVYLIGAVFCLFAAFGVVSNFEFEGRKIY